MKYQRTGRRLLFLLAGVLLAASISAAERTVTIDESFDSGLVNLAVDETLAVRLPACAAGKWSIAFNDAASLKPVGAPQAEGEERVFRFRGAAKGSSGLGLACLDAADTTAKPSRLFRVFVVVGDKVNAKNPRLREGDGGSRIYLAEGDTLSVWLPATASTGIGWSIDRNATSVLRPVGDPKFDGPTTNTPGAPGTQIFEFKVVGRGASLLELGYGKVTDKAAPPQKTWKIFVAAAGVKAGP